MKTISALGRASLALLGLLVLVAFSVAFSPSVPVADAQSAPAPDVAPTLPPYTSLAPVRVLGMIRRVFRSHRPPPPYITYTLVRTQKTNYGYPDPVGSYTRHIWCRTIDRAALSRYVYRDDYRGPLAFDRPAMNEDRDPGPPTADVFEPAPARPHPIDWVPTPEPTLAPLRTIGAVVAYGEPDYNVTSITVEGNLLHLLLQPRRDPERNILREIWVDKHTYELRKIIAHDRLFDQGSDNNVWPVVFTYTLGYVDNYLVVTHLHGVVGEITEKDGTVIPYDGDGKIVDFDFQDIQFPKDLPSWYFDPHSYAQHVADAPQ